MGLAVGTAKFLLFVFNFIFFATGVAIIVIGGLALKEQAIIDNNFSTSISGVPIFLIVVGVLVALISFFGCCGAMKNSHCMLLTFAFLLGLIFVCELAAGIAAYIKRDDIADIVKEEFDKMIKDYGANSSTTDKGVDELQEFYKCCGRKGPDDWKNNNHTHGTMPHSCCDPDKVKKEDPCNDGNSYKKGCYDALAKSISENAGFYGAAGIGIAFIQILGIVLSCCLATAVKDQV